MKQSFPVVAQALGGRRQAGAAQRPHYTSGWLLAIAALLVATQLNAAHLLENRFHPDEALYATFARTIASGPGRGLLLSHMLVDKPPLAFYLDAASVAVFGSSEFALRLPTLLASLVGVALVYAIGRRVFGRTAGLAAAWAMTLSPFAIQFSITVFVDPLLTTWVLLAILLLVRQRPGWAALALSLAWATKQTALLFFPLAILLGVVRLPAPAQTRAALNFFLRAALPALAGVILVTALVVAWDQRRGAPIGTYQQGYGDNIATRLAQPGELGPRADAIAGMLRQFTGNDWVSAALLAGLAALLLFDLGQRSQRAWADWLLAAYVLLYLGGYWIVSLNLFDRYFLPLVPLLALLVGRLADRAGAALAGLSQRLAFGRAPVAGRGCAWARLAAPLILLAAVVPVVAAANYSFSPIGGDHGAYDGIDDAARFIRTLPRNSVLYDRWLTWEFDYYLFDRPVEMFYFRDVAVLARNVAMRGRRRPCYLVVPWWVHDPSLQPDLASAGYNLSLVHQSWRRDGVVSIALYRLDPAK